MEQKYIYIKKKKNTQCDTRIDTDSEYIKRLAVPGTLARSNQGLFRADPSPGSTRRRYTVNGYHHLPPPDE